jgi:hypothetical protein
VAKKGVADCSSEKFGFFWEIVSHVNSV